LNKGRIINGLFIIAIGAFIILGLNESEPAMVYFITEQLGFSIVQGLGLGATLIFIGLIIAMAGALSRTKKKEKINKNY